VRAFKEGPHPPFVDPLPASGRGAQVPDFCAHLPTRWARVSAPHRRCGAALSGSPSPAPLVRADASTRYGVLRSKTQPACLPALKTKRRGRQHAVRSFASHNAARLLARPKNQAAQTPARGTEFCAAQRSPLACPPSPSAEGAGGCGSAKRTRCSLSHPRALHNSCVLISIPPSADRGEEVEIWESAVITKDAACPRSGPLTPQPLPHKWEKGVGHEESHACGAGGLRRHPHPL
jgi:hypothetical protein